MRAQNYDTLNHFKEFQYDHAPIHIINYDNQESTTEIDESDDNLKEA